jgi:hypothetical protein
MLDSKEQIVEALSEIKESKQLGHRFFRTLE